MVRIGGPSDEMKRLPRLMNVALEVLIPCHGLHCLSASPAESEAEGVVDPGL